MKTLLTAIILIVFALPAYAVDPTQLVFSITSSAATSTANLRVIPMGKFLPRDGDNIRMQTFAWEVGKLANYFLTKSQTVDITNQKCVWVQVDQGTTVKLNSETAFMTLYADTDKILCFK